MRPPNYLSRLHLDLTIKTVVGDDCVTWRCAHVVTRCVSALVNYNVSSFSRTVTVCRIFRELMMISGKV
jgi:hypothetical protein